jgi:hypothetical protein
VLELFDYWRDAPPAHELLAAALGVRPRSKQGESSGVEEKITFVHLWGGRVRPLAELPPILQTELAQLNHHG